MKEGDKKGGRERKKSSVKKHKKLCKRGEK